MADHVNVTGTINSLPFVMSADITLVADVAPVLSAMTAVATSTTEGSLSVTTDDTNGTLYRVVTQSATKPSKAQVKAGQDQASALMPAGQRGSQAVTASGVYASTTTGLTNATNYFAHWMHEDAAGNQSAVASSAQFTTSSSAVNLTTNPNAFHLSPWGVQGSTVTAAFAIGPDSVAGSAARLQLLATASLDRLRQTITVPGGTASKTIRVACFVKRNGAVDQQFRLRNTHVTDLYSADMIATATWQEFEFIAVNSSAAGTGDQGVGIAENAAGAAADLLIHMYKTEDIT